MKYLIVPKSGQYNVSYVNYVILDKITSWTDHYIYIEDNRHYVETDWTAEEIERAIKEAEETNTYIESLREKPIEKLYVDGATSKKNADESQWEMRFNGILVEPQVGEIKEVWKNVTVEVLELPSGELSVGWRRQEDSEQIL